ncbi:MAG: hypothetical protein CVU65_16570, partial [Deltaproteobacteria bacterium HGW-Deltaproteobacteria-22]
AVTRVVVAVNCVVVAVTRVVVAVNCVVFAVNCVVVAVNYVVVVAKRLVFGAEIESPRSRGLEPGVNLETDAPSPDRVLMGVCLSAEPVAY